MIELNKYSKVLTQDQTQPAAQAMLYGIGLTDDDLKKAQIGVCSMGYDGNTCNMHLNGLAILIKQGFTNFQYTVADNKGIIDHENAIDGNFYQTENDYSVIVYYRKNNDRYDRVIGKGTASSLNIIN